MFIIKIGGSVLTDKKKESCFKQEISDNIAKEIKKTDKKYIIIHGAGSFGHILAKKYHLHTGRVNDVQLQGFSLTQSMVQKLNSLVMDSLHKNNIPAVSIPPHTFLKLNNNKPDKMDFGMINDYIKEGFIPVSFGDVVLDKKLGFSICSGDLLIQIFTDHFKPEKAIFVIDEDGLYTSNPKSTPNAKLIKKARMNEIDFYSTSLDTHDDVTGGMKGKLETIKNISRIGIDTVLVNGNKPDRLYKVLVGEDTISTTIYGGKK
jgi:isopentenyl phosphate kinase